MKNKHTLDCDSIIQSLKLTNKAIELGIDVEHASNNVIVCVDGNNVGEYIKLFEYYIDMIKK